MHSRRRHGRGAPVTWLSHVHLHFGTRAIERRFALHERFWSAAAQLPLSKAAAQPPHSKVHISNVVRHAVIRRQRLLVMRSAGVPPAVPPPARRPAIRPAGGGRSTERFFRTLSRVRSEAVRSETKLLSSPPARPPELVWRSVPSPLPQARIAGEAPPPHGSASVITTQRTVAFEQQAPPSLPGQPAPRVKSSDPALPGQPGQPALRMKDFDPALLDRLTDDVIRRVERRARIERERHGR